MQTAKIVAPTLWDHYSVYYRLPDKILSDQGHNFKGSLIAELCAPFKIKNLQTGPYHHQVNGQCKCFNLKLISMLRALLNLAYTNWPKHVVTLVHTYNYTRSNTTGFSLYFLMCMTSHVAYQYQVWCMYIRYGI